MLSPDEATKLVKDRLFPGWETEKTRLDRIDRWYRWEQEPITLPRKATLELRQLAELSRVPWLSLVVTATAQAMYVDGYRSQLDPAGGSPSGPSAPWRTWLANAMDRRQVPVHRAMLAYGYSFMKVLPGVDPMTGDAQSVMRGVSPRKMFALWDDPAEDDWPQYAMQVVESSRSSHLVRVYDEMAEHTLRVEDTGSKVEYQGGPKMHGAGVCPMVRYSNMLDLDGRTPGEVEPFIAAAARINKTAYDRMLVQHFNSWKVRTVSGMAEPDNVDDATRKKLQLRQDDLLVAEDPDTKFGTLDEALALPTPLPTPTGWTTMGAVKVGDQLIGADGLPTTVVKTTEIQSDRICYRVVFRDGTSLVASDGHRWLTRVVGHNQKHTLARVRTTGEMVDDGRRMAVPVAPPVKTSDVELSVDPYVLGLWLGDGDAKSARITAGRTDADELIDAIAARGYTASKGHVAPPRAERLNISIPNASRSRSLSLNSRLRQQDLLGNKHIPAVYLRAGVDQRLELLRGLMDSDGSVTPEGYCCFVQTSEQLTDDVTELLRGLGQVVTVRRTSDTRSRQGGYYKIGFQPRWEIQPFAVRRKAERVKARRAHDGWTAIVTIEPVPTEPVRCVGVDAPDQLFLAGEGWHVTHNTPIEGLIAGHRSDVETLAAVSQTPTHELTGQMANLPLALDTVVPLPGGGRTTMANVSVGDQVIDPTGLAVKVTALSPIYHGRECYRLRFDDGNEIVADAAHKWSTTHFVNPKIPYARRRGAQRKTDVVTTAEIAATLKTSMGTNNHFVSVAAPHDGPAQSFDVDPYVLGVWLGDGDHTHGTVTSHKDDADELARHLRECGEIVKIRPYPKNDKAHRDTRLVVITKDHTRCPFGHERPLGTGHSCRECGRIRDSLRYNGVRKDWPERTNVSFAARLETLGVRRNKHIPEQYFHGSVKQRLALMQGIMDTDGTVNRKQGSAVITLHHERLSHDLHRLIQSLGHKVALRHRTWTSKQLGSTGECWRMSWSAVDPVFRLGRKRDLQRTDFTDGGDGKASSPFRRYIVACDRVESVPVRCITVDSETHLFCVTDAHIATHNSAEALAAARASLNQKVTERQKSAGSAHSQALRLAASLAGDDDYASDVTGRVTWQDMEIRSMSQAVDALVKAATIGIPLPALWSRIPGVEKSDVDEWIKMAEAGDPIRQMQAQLERQSRTSADADLDFAGAGDGLN